MDSNLPRCKEDLGKWFKDNPNASFKMTKVSMTSKEGVLSREISHVKRVLKSVEEKGVYFTDGEGSIISWFGLDSLKDQQLIFTDNYFAVFLLEEMYKLQGKEIITLTTMQYDYEHSKTLSRNINGILNCSVNDDNFDAALKRLTDGELKYCLEHETRKTGLKKLKRESLKRQIS